MRLSSVLSVFLSFAIISHGAPISKRRFGNEGSPQAVSVFQDIKNLTQGTDKESEGADLSVSAIEALFADAPACDQQDKADEIIDLGHALGGEKEKQLIQVAITYRQLERNTPDVGQPSELCEKSPKNKEINGLLQAQDLASTTTPDATPYEPAKTATPNEPDPDDPTKSATPNEPYSDYSTKTATPNEPDPDDPAKTATPNEPDPDDPAKTVTPNEPYPEYSTKTATPNEPDPDDPAKTVTPNEPDPDDPDKKESNSASNDDSGNVLPKDPDEDSEHNNDGSSATSNMPQDFA